MGADLWSLQTFGDTEAKEEPDGNSEGMTSKAGEEQINGQPGGQERASRKRESTVSNAPQG